jgi:hypothetical protein
MSRLRLRTELTVVAFMFVLYGCGSTSPKLPPLTRAAAERRDGAVTSALRDAWDRVLRPLRAQVTEGDIVNAPATTTFGMSADPAVGADVCAAHRPHRGPQTWGCTFTLAWEEVQLRSQYVPGQGVQQAGVIGATRKYDVTVTGNLDGNGCLHARFRPEDDWSGSGSPPLLPPADLQVPTFVSFRPTARNSYYSKSTPC